MKMVCLKIQNHTLGGVNPRGLTMVTAKSHIDESTLVAAQQQMAQQAFAQIPDVVKRVRASVRLA